MFSKKHHEVLYQNSWYQMIRKHNGTLNFRSAGGQATLVKAVYLHSEFIINKKLFTTNQKLRCDLENNQLTNGLDIACKNSACVTDISICCGTYVPKIGFSVLSKFLVDLKIIRHAILFDFDVPLSAIIKKNRQMQEKNFPKKAWLDKQGVIFGTGTNSAFIYHAPDISSLETIPSKNRLIVNLDYHKDHPQVMNNPAGGYFDRSHSYYSAGEETSYYFSIVLGYQPPFFLRFMSPPKGFLATHVWTEHACHSDLRVHKALYYGSELIQKPDLAKGGFVKHNIPVTKSVFYKNELETKNEDPTNLFNGPMVSIKGSSDFASFLSDLQQMRYYDICLHSAQPQTSTPEQCEEALEYMKENFDSVCWIDHLSYRSRSTKGCREAITCEGLDPASPHYMKPLWLQYGIKYFWSYSSELLRRQPDPWLVQKGLKYKSAVLEMLKAGEYIRGLSYTAYKITEKIKAKYKSVTNRGKSEIRPLNMWDASDGNSNPIYWRTPPFPVQNNGTRSSYVYSWATRANYFPGAESEDPYTKKGLERLIREWGICFSHAYPVSVYLGDRNSAWHINQDGKVEISAFFDSLLKTMCQLREDNELYLTTIRQILDYWIKLERIEIEYRPLEDAARIYNYNLEAIEGLAFVSKGAEIFVNGEKPQLKQDQGQIIFWFDMDPLSYTTISSKCEHSRGHGKTPQHFFDKEDSH